MPCNYKRNKSVRVRRFALWCAYPHAQPNSATRRVRGQRLLDRRDRSGHLRSFLQQYFGSTHSRCAPSRLASRAWAAAVTAARYAAGGLNLTLT